MSLKLLMEGIDFQLALYNGRLEILCKDLDQDEETEIGKTQVKCQLLNYNIFLNEFPIYISKPC